HGSTDLTLLDQKHSVPRDPGIQQGALVDGSDVPEPRHEQAALDTFDQLVERLRHPRAFEAIASRERRRLDALLIRPEAIVGEVLEHAVLDPRGARHRQSLAGEWRGEQIGILRVGRDSDALIDHLLPDAISTATL